MRKALFLIAAAAAAATAPASASDLKNIDHVVVIYGENRSFDHLYGLFPGANGVQHLAPAQYLQEDTDGTPLKTLPPVWKERGQRGEVDPVFADQAPLPNRPFRLDLPPYRLGINQLTRDLVHRFYENQEQINGGSNSHFAAVSDAGGLSMGYYDGSSMKLWQLARQYTLADNFFMGAFGGSFLNHMWLVCACTPSYPNAPAAMKAALDADGKKLLRKSGAASSALLAPPDWVANGAITPDDFAVNTIQPPYQPSGLPPAAGGDLALSDPAKHPLPAQTAPTIGDRLSAKGVSWAWYSGAWEQALADGQQDPALPRKVIYKGNDGAPNFQTHHQPLNYFASFAPGTQARAEHLKDYAALQNDIAQGQLPQVVFYKPQGNLNQHPGYADVMDGDEHIAQLVEKIQHSPQWKHTLIIITYDENGGFWDHVAPPKGDRWGPGTRIPTILISPWVKRHFVDHTQYDTTSILKFITRRFGLEPLAGVRDTMGDLSQSLK